MHCFTQRGLCCHCRAEKFLRIFSNDKLRLRPDPQSATIKRKRTGTMGLLAGWLPPRPESHPPFRTASTRTTTTNLIHHPPTSTFILPNSLVRATATSFVALLIQATSLYAAWQTKPVPLTPCPWECKPNGSNAGPRENAPPIYPIRLRYQASTLMVLCFLATNAQHHMSSLLISFQVKPLGYLLLNKSGCAA